jgi:hypothetical protein
VGFFAFHKGGIIHLLAVVAVVILVFRLLYNKTELP